MHVPGSGSWGPYTAVVRPPSPLMHHPVWAVLGGLLVYVYQETTQHR